MYMELIVLLNCCLLINSTKCFDGGYKGFSSSERNNRSMRGFKLSFSIGPNISNACVESSNILHLHLKYSDTSRWNSYEIIS